MSNVSKTLFLLIIIELIIISFIGFYTYKKITKTTKIVRINKDSILSSSTKNLIFFWEPKPNSIEKVNEWIPNIENYTITINSDSLNERFEYPVNKPQKIYRIITLGDSFTYGLYTDTASNWTEILEDKLNSMCDKNNSINKFEIINLGVYGYDIQYSIERFKSRGKKYQPDFIIWFLKDDDFQQLNEIMIQKERIYSQKLKETGEFEKLVARGDLYPSWRMAMEETFKEIGENTLLKIQIKFIQEFLNFYKNKLLFITFPSTKTKFKNIMSYFSKINKNVFFTDKITEINNFENLHFKNDGHPNKRGHKKIAEDLFDYLTTTKVIPCKF